ncbi:hypothetical protein [Streptococcus hyovaginalis]|uniref:hypothetical protein n=1 Tax=Streptococcus TaxID=1301 RepID=UPI0012FE20D8
MRSHVQDIGWQSPVTSSQVIGTTGCGKRLEAVELSLTPDMSSLGDIIYQSHV